MLSYFKGGGDGIFGFIVAVTANVILHITKKCYDIFFHFKRNEKLEAEAKSAIEKFEEVRESSCED